MDGHFFLDMGQVEQMRQCAEAAEAMVSGMRAAKTVSEMMVTNSLWSSGRFNEGGGDSSNFVVGNRYDLRYGGSNSLRDGGTGGYR